MLVIFILFDDFFHQLCLHGFHFKTFLLLSVKFLYIIKLCVAATKSFLHAYVKVVISSDYVILVNE